jgi:hypothetical protein
MRTFKELHRPYQTHIWLKRAKLYLGSYQTLEEASVAYDAAAVMAHGKESVTNQSLGLLDPKVAQTKDCRRAAKQARRIIKLHRSGELAKLLKTYWQAKTFREKAAIMAGVRAVGKPAPGTIPETGAPLSHHVRRTSARASPPSQG